MGLFGGGGGTLGLGGTKYDPTTYGGTLGDVTGGIQDIYEDNAGDFGEIPGALADWTGWSDYTKDMATGAGYLDPANVPDWLKDMWDKGAEAFYEGMDKTEENLADIAGDIETGIDENTDTLNQMEDTFNYNVDQGNALLGNTTAALGDASSLINQGLDATININNPDSIVSSPQNWYENAAGVGKGGWSLDWLEEAQTSALESGLTGTLGQILSGTDDPWNQYWPDDDEGGGAGGGLGTYRGRRSIAGDPFASSAETRRLIQQQDTFQSRLKKNKNTAPSMINASSYA